MSVPETYGQFRNIHIHFLVFGDFSVILLLFIPVWLHYTREYFFVVVFTVVVNHGKCFMYIKKEYIFWQYWMILCFINDKWIQLVNVIVKFIYYYSDFVSSAPISYWGRSVKFSTLSSDVPVSPLLLSFWLLKPCPVYINRLRWFILAEFNFYHYLTLLFAR